MRKYSSVWPWDAASDPSGSILVLVYAQYYPYCLGANPNTTINCVVLGEQGFVRVERRQSREISCLHVV